MCLRVQGALGAPPPPTRRPPPPRPPPLAQLLDGRTGFDGMSGAELRGVAGRMYSGFSLIKNKVPSVHGER